MKAYQIISDGSCDLSPEQAKENKIDVVPFYVSFDSTTYMRENVDITEDEFYRQMIDNPKVFPKSSLPSVQDYINCYTEYAKADIAMVVICITSKFSGSYNSACTARDILLEDYPNAQITVIDSRVNTCLQGLLVLEAARMQAEGYDYEDVVSRMEAIKDSGRIFFTIGSIDYLAHGGRIGKLAGLAASTLGLRPLIQLKEGEIFSSGLSRSRKKSLTKTLAQVREHFDKIKEAPETYSFTVGYGHNIEEAESFRDELVALFDGKISRDDVPLQRIGAAIAVHTGPEAIGVGLIRKFDAPAVEAAPSVLTRIRSTISSTTRRGNTTS